MDILHAHMRVYVRFGDYLEMFGYLASYRHILRSIQVFPAHSLRLDIFIKREYKTGQTTRQTD